MNGQKNLESHPECEFILGKQSSSAGIYQILFLLFKKNTLTISQFVFPV